MPRDKKGKQTVNNSKESFKIEPSLLEKSPYLKKIIKFNDNVIQCLTCKEGWSSLNKNEGKYTFAKRWLPFHLVTSTHIKYEKDKPGLLEAAKLFGKTISIDNSNDLRNEEESKSEPLKSELENKSKQFETKSSLKEKEERENCDEIEDTKAVNRKNEISLIFDVAEFMINKHLPFDSAPDILEFAQKISSKYSTELVNHAHTSSTTITQVVKVCIGDTLKGKIYKKLTESPFSLLLDASSDLYGEEIVPSLVHVKDVCHAFNKIAEEATKHFPKFIIDFLKEVCSFITRSPQRRIKFKELQALKQKGNPSFNPNELGEVPTFKEIRWLSLSKPANYVSRHWKELAEFYQTQDNDIKINFTVEYKLCTDLLALLSQSR